jgi:hypothetical protein
MVSVSAFFRFYAVFRGVGEFIFAGRVLRFFAASITWVMWSGVISASWGRFLCFFVSLPFWVKECTGIRNLSC